MEERQRSDSHSCCHLHTECTLLLLAQWMGCIGCDLLLLLFMHIDPPPNQEQQVVQRKVKRGCVWRPVTPLPEGLSSGYRMNALFSFCLFHVTVLYWSYKRYICIAKAFAAQLCIGQCKIEIASTGPAPYIQIFSNVTLRL